jgi:peroxiredoxin
MIELGQLEKRHGDLEQRQTRVVVASLEGTADAAKTQSDFPHLLVLADSDRHLAEAAGVIHRKSKFDGDDTSAPTTVLIDRHGVVRWIHRPERNLARLSVDELLNAIDQNLGASASR